MYLSTSVDKYISEKLIADREKERANRQSSGKLSASKLWWPALWWWLEKNGFEQTPPDEFSLRKFERGKQVEDWLVKNMPAVKETQKFVEYRDAIGYVDALVDTNELDIKKGIIPHEIKSISNAKYKRVVFKKQPDTSHILQATFYAMALKKEDFAIIYVASDDFRINHWVFQVKDYRDRVDAQIDEYNTAIKLTERPAFEPREDWQRKPMYCPFGNEGIK